MTAPVSPTPSDQPDSFEDALRDLTIDRGPEARLWERALAQDDAERHTRMSTTIAARMHRPLPARLMAVAAMLILGVLVVAALLPSLGHARRSARSTAAGVRIQAGPADFPASPASEIEKSDGINYQSTTRADLSLKKIAGDEGPVARGDLVDRRGRLMPPATSAPAPDAARSVIRKATLELDTPDVRAAFAKAQMVIRPDLGEFIEGSSLNGETKHAIAQITFRFAVSRMDIALNELRPLGTVKSETASGDDVTAQVVDLDARLRNERRVEQEVLALLESRKDAPLKEILDLRDKLSELRQNIEQLQGRKDNLSRQVSLSTVLLIIRPVDAPPEDPKSQLTPIGVYFSEQFENAWRSGTQNLADALSWLIRTVIGGLPWWIVIAALALFIRRLIRRAAANAPQNTWARPPLATGSPASPA